MAEDLFKKYRLDEKASLVNAESVDYEDMSDFRRSTEAGKVNESAANREMPEEDIVERVRQTGVNKAMADYKPPWGTTMIRTVEDAKRAVAILRSVPDRIHAWDTETIDLDVRSESPVGKGRILCAQCFAGPDLDFGNGPRLFIDNYADAEGLIETVFKDYLEDPSMKKVWHNYGFDRHIMANHDIDVKGFGGDTMHMARLADPSRLRYGLKYLTQYLEGEIIQVKNALITE